MKKRIFHVLLALLTVSAIASCGDSAAEKPVETQAQKQDGEAGTEAVTEEVKIPSPYDLMETKDFEGMTYTVFDCNAYPEMHINMPGDSLTGELVNDALINRDTAVEDRFNVDIGYYQEANINKLNKAVQAGDAVYDLVITDMPGLSSAATGHILYNLREIPEVDLSGMWWSPLMAEALTLNGATYFSACDIAPALYQAPSCMFLNLKLYTDYDIETDIYQLVLDGKWTFDALWEITKDMDIDVNGDGKWDCENDSYGVGIQPIDESASSFLSSSGIPLCTVSENGEELIFDIANNADVIAACEKFRQIFKTIPYKDVNDIINITFKENRALFLHHKLQSAAVHLRDMEADYLILPDPKFTEAQPHYQSFVSNHVCGFTGVPATIDPETSGYLTEALARYSNEYLRPIAFDIVYKEKDTRDPRSADVLDVLFDNLYIDFALAYNFGNISDTLAQIIFQDKDYVSTLTKRSSSMAKAVAKVMDNWNVE